MRGVTVGEVLCAALGCIEVALDARSGGLPSAISSLRLELGLASGPLDESAVARSPRSLLARLRRRIEQLTDES